MDDYSQNSAKSYSCKAASADNALETQQIIELFTAVYDDGYPIASVYDPLYWRQHIGRRFTSILIYDGRKLIGHLAAQAEGIDGKMVQILFPLCHPDYSEDFDIILRRAWAIFEKQAERQSWHGIYYFAFADIPEMVYIGEHILQVKPTALCPAYFPALKLIHSSSSNLKKKKATKERTDIVIGQRFFSPERDKSRSIYVSEDYAELISKVYKSLNLPREIHTDVKKEKLSRYPLPADRSAIETRYFAKSGIMHAYIEPSLLANESELSEHFLDPHSESTFVFVKAYDPRALQTIAWLERNGFEFSGILPFIHDRESLLFSHCASDVTASVRDAETILLSGFSGW